MDSAVTDEEQQLKSEMELLDAADFVGQKWHLFFDNRFTEVKELVKPFMETSVYHASCNAFLDYINGFTCFDKDNIDVGIDSLSKVITMCDERCHKWSLFDNVIMHMFVSTDYNTYSEEEVHCELIKACSLLAKAMLTFCKDDSIFSFIRGALYIRSSHHLFKRCEDALQQRTWTNDRLKEHFESGVKFGIGFFNLVLSALPKRLLMLLEFVGFSGKRDLALKFLKCGHGMTNAYASALSSMTIFTYYVNIRYILGNGLNDYEIEDCEKLLQIFNEEYPQSTLALYYSARLLLIRGNVDEAIAVLRTSVAKTAQWTGFHQLSYWELYYCYLLSGEYRSAVKFGDIAIKTFRWSSSLCSYMKAVALLMCDDLTSDERNEIESLMRDTVSKRQILGGKYSPPETYVAYRAAKYLSDRNASVLLVFELLYMWSYFPFLHNKPNILEPILATINITLDDLQNEKLRETRLYSYMDKYCMAQLLKGICLVHMLKPKQALELFLEIYNNQEKIKEDHFLVSCALMEIGFIYYNEAKHEKATEYMEKAKINAPYFGEYRIHQAYEDMELAKRK